ncbi:MAG: hypothetical protein C4B58_14015 [Deltaproteobacteria bacterium]|nr:MAG: hypothetical protein C4B58_14015 [Deltaproteobacteria bacterium]
MTQKYLAGKVEINRIYRKFRMRKEERRVVMSKRLMKLTMALVIMALFFAGSAALGGIEFLYEEDGMEFYLTDDGRILVAEHFGLDFGHF